MESIILAKKMFEDAVNKSGRNFRIEKSISGYYRLLLDDEIKCDDSAFEDVQDEESALYYFAYLINEYNNGEEI